MKSLLLLATFTLSVTVAAPQNGFFSGITNAFNDFFGGSNTRQPPRRPQFQQQQQQQFQQQQQQQFFQPQPQPQPQAVRQPVASSPAFSSSSNQIVGGTAKSAAQAPNHFWNGKGFVVTWKFGCRDFAQHETWKFGCRDFE